jgi:transposase InsO family protein
VNTVLHFCHADLLSSHLGLTKTLDKVRRHAFWPGWRKDVREYLSECRKCGGGKGPRPRNSGRIQPMPIADLTGPFSLLVVDAVGPLPETRKGNKYILVFVDYFTRWAEAFAVDCLDSVTFVETMVNGVVARHGVPARLLSDNGGNFSSDIAKSFYQILGLKKLFGAAYHPQTQGLVERFNGTLIGMELYKSLRASRHLVERQLVKAQDRHAMRLEGQVAVNYEVGSPVWIYQFFRARKGENRTKKLAFAWHGPYRVVSKVGENTYRIEIPSHPDKVVPVNVNRLKPVRGRWTRSYMDEVPSSLDDEDLEDGPFVESDLPTSSFVERRTVGREDTVLTGTSAPLLEVVAKRRVNREVQYLALASNYETFWLPRAVLVPEYGSLVTAFENAERRKRGLPALRQSARLVEANAEVDEDEILMM